MPRRRKHEALAARMVPAEQYDALRRDHDELALRHGELSSRHAAVMRRLEALEAEVWRSPNSPEPAHVVG